jgi:hypothetical protein
MKNNPHGIISGITTGGVWFCDDRKSPINKKR